MTTRDLTVARPDSGLDAPSEPLRDRLFWHTFSKMLVFTILFEDTDAEAPHLGLDETSRVLTVAAAGCGVAGLLAAGPARIDAVDGNPHHLALTALKVEAARRLASHEELYALFGHGRHARAEAVLKDLTAELPGWMQAHWARRHGMFRKGLYRHGLFSRTLAAARAIAGLDVPLMRHIAALPASERPAAMRAAGERLLSHPMAAAVARSPVMLLAHGINFRQRDRNLRSEGTTDMARVALNHAVRIGHTDVASNWILWHTMTGQFDHDHPACRPAYLREPAHARSFGARTVTAYHRASFLEVMRAAPAAHWSHYNFSDAVDWMDEPVQRLAFEEVLRTARPGAILVNRTVEAECPIAKLGLSDRFRRLDAASDAATRDERSRLYHRVDLYRVQP